MTTLITLKNFIEKDNRFDAICFVVFSDEGFEIYETTLY